MVCCLLIAGCRGGSIHSDAPSPDGSVIASIRVAEVIMPAPDNSPVLSHKSYLRIQRMPPSAASNVTETLITTKPDEQYFLYAGGLTWSPNGRSVAFATGNVAVYGKKQPCRLWFLDISAKPEKALIAEGVHCFRWEDDTHLVYVAQDGAVYRVTVSHDGAPLDLKPLLQGGYLRDAGSHAYHYCGLSAGGFAFNNPLSPNARFLVYAESGSLIILDLSTASIENSFPLLGTPIAFWWDDASRNVVIGVQRKQDSYSHTHHYYLYQREKGTLTPLANRLKDTSQFSAWRPSGGGRVWCSDGKHLVLNSGHPYYKTWLFDTTSLAAVWMEREMKGLKAGIPSPLTMVPLPLEDGEYDSSRDPLPAYPDLGTTNHVSMEQKRNKTIRANNASKVVIEPSPHRNRLAVCLPVGERKNAKSTSTCFLLSIGATQKGEASLVVHSTTEVEGGERFLWTSDGRRLLFGAGAKWRWASVH